MAAEVAVTSRTLVTEGRFKVAETNALLDCVLLTVATRPTSIDAVLPIAAEVAVTVPPRPAFVRVMPALVSAIARATLFWLVLITVRCAMADETTEALSATAAAVMKSDFLFTGYFPLFADETFCSTGLVTNCRNAVFGYEVQTSMRIGSTMPLIPLATQTFLHRLIVGPAPGREGLI